MYVLRAAQLIRSNYSNFHIFIFLVYFLQFDVRKMGNDNISADARADLEQSLNARLGSLRNANNAKRNAIEAQRKANDANERYKDMAMKASGYGLAGAAVCALFFGPVGMTACAVGAAVAGGASSHYGVGISDLFRR